MRNIVIQYFFLGIISFLGYGQVAQYNQFPAMQPQHILDDKLESISFAFSLRILASDYDGPIIRLRRDTDDAEEDFMCSDTDIVDVNAIDTWRGAANVYVVTWYDQSGLGRNAVQNNTAFQPQFFPDAVQPYFVGDGINDLLVVSENFQILTEGGKNGSVFGVFLATDRADSAFGVTNGSERWLVHINWNNEKCYFDPGYCCNDPRSFVNNLPTDVVNPGSIGIWDQYSFIRRDDAGNAATDRVILRIGTTEKVNGGFPNAQSCNLNVNFGLCALITNASDNGTGYSTTRFAEIIMYSVGLEDSFFEEIEENQVSFWNL